MKTVKWSLQFIITLLLSTFIPNNYLKTIALLIFWGISFYPIAKLEIIFFITSSFLFVVANFGALKNLTFDFAVKDIFLMPYNELFMWGFYCLNAHRFINVEAKARVNIKKLLLYIVGFATTFSVVHNENVLCGILLLIFIIALLNFKSQRGIKYIGYFLFMGIVVETLGLSFNLWNYPHAIYFPIPIWAPLMWSNIGLIMSQVTTLIFNKTSINNLNNERG